MTGQSDMGWKAVQKAGAQVSIAFPIEMNMRHGIPPIIKMQQLGMEPSLSVDVECTMTADFFTQMRVAMNMQRMVANQLILEQNTTTKIETANDSFYHGSRTALHRAISGRLPHRSLHCLPPATCCVTPP